MTEPEAPTPQTQQPSSAAPAPAAPAEAPPIAAYAPPARTTPVPPAIAASPRPRLSTGWKLTIAALVLVTLASMAGCCGMASVAGLTGAEPGMTFADSVAVIHVDGVIAGTGSTLDGIINPETMSSYLDQAAQDPNVRAIVLRIDSPGGTVAASQEIATEVARLSAEKPVIASVGDVGASGAYMIASQCDEIWAQPTSAVGSIGVITEIPNVAGLLEKVGVEFTVLTAGEFKDAGSPYRSLTETETQLIQREIDIAYDEFIRIVAEGREMSEDDVRDLATGWAWSAIQAQEMGLVDEMGTYNDALDRAAELGGISGDYEVIVYDEYEYGDLLSYLIGIRDDLDRLKSLSPDVAPLAPAVPR